MASKFLLSFLILLSVVDAAPKRRPTIFCVIHTTASAHETRLSTILRTWAQKCDDKLIFTDAPVLNAPNVSHVYFPVMATRSHSWEKIRRIFRFLHEKLEDRYDWVLRADDDSFVHMENARRLAAEYDPEKPLVLGYRWGFFAPRGYVDGGVYMVSRAGVRVFNEIMTNDKICPDFHRAEEDQELGKCMAKVGIYPTYTRDAQGKDRFHHFHVDELQSLLIRRFTRNYAFYKSHDFPNGISDTSVSFHHLSPYEMQLANYLTSRLKLRTTNE
ncbi:hypothetical protein M3Y98_01184200 [Aphelenchoides besseyi]|nr:hypothetical protein M3Y98_01184200 [Aphelenchoides besseyi]KAI6195232.1 hypothetical protein M3Y96_01209100 [Aphelenchoides besseyi]